MCVIPDRWMGWVSPFSPKFLLTRLIGMGAAYGTARSGAACAAGGIERPDLVMKVLIYLKLQYCKYTGQQLIECQSLLPTVMAGIISVYALVVSLLIVGDMSPSPTQNYSLYR